jgi:hypothetical protein
MYACLFCMYACVYACIYVCTYVVMYVCMHVCINACMVKVIYNYYALLDSCKCLIDNSYVNAGCHLIPVHFKKKTCIYYIIVKAM